MLRALVRSAEFRQSVGTKVRDPGEDLVATYRALDVQIAAAAGDAGDAYAANQMLWQVAGIGTKPFDWPRPDGQPIDNDAWSSPGAADRVDAIHRNLAGGWWPNKGARYRRPEGGCRSGPSASTTSSTTCPSASCTGRATAAPARGVLPGGRRAGRSEKITRTTGWCGGTCPGCCPPSSTPPPT